MARRLIINILLISQITSVASAGQTGSNKASLSDFVYRQRIELLDKKIKALFSGSPQQIRSRIEKLNSLEFLGLVAESANFEFDYADAEIRKQIKNIGRQDKAVGDYLSGRLLESSQKLKTSEQRLAFQKNIELKTALGQGETLKGLNPGIDRVSPRGYRNETLRPGPRNQGLANERANLADEVRARVTYFQQMNHYQVLRVRPDASLDEIKQAYEKLKFDLNPNRFQTEEQTAAKAAVIQADQSFKVLSDVRLRYEYDISQGIMTPETTQVDGKNVESRRYGVSLKDIDGKSLVFDDRRGLLAYIERYPERVDPELRPQLTIEQMQTRINEIDRMTDLSFLTGLRQEPEFVEAYKERARSLYETTRNFVRYNGSHILGGNAGFMLGMAVYNTYKAFLPVVVGRQPDMAMYQMAVDSLTDISGIAGLLGFSLTSDISTHLLAARFGAGGAMHMGMVLGSLMDQTVRKYFLLIERQNMKLFDYEMAQISKKKAEASRQIGNITAQLQTAARFSKGDAKLISELETRLGKAQSTYNRLSRQHADSRQRYWKQFELMLKKLPPQDEREWIQFAESSTQMVMVALALHKFDHFSRKYLFRSMGPEEKMRLRHLVAERVRNLPVEERPTGIFIKDATKAITADSVAVVTRNSSLGRDGFKRILEKVMAGAVKDLYTGMNKLGKELVKDRILPGFSGATFGAVITSFISAQRFLGGMDLMHDQWTKFFGVSGPRGLKNSIRNAETRIQDSARRLLYFSYDRDADYQEFKKSLWEYHLAWEEYRNTTIQSGLMNHYMIWQDHLKKATETHLKDYEYLKWLATGADRSDKGFLANNGAYDSSALKPEERNDETLVCVRTNKEGQVGWHIDSFCGEALEREIREQRAKFAFLFEGRDLKNPATQKAIRIHAENLNANYRQFVADHSRSRKLLMQELVEDAFYKGSKPNIHIAIDKAKTFKNRWVHILKNIPNPIFPTYIPPYIDVDAYSKKDPRDFFPAFNLRDSYIQEFEQLKRILLDVVANYENLEKTSTDIHLFPKDSAPVLLPSIVRTLEKIDLSKKDNTLLLSDIQKLVMSMESRPIFVEFNDSPALKKQFILAVEKGRVPKPAKHWDSYLRNGPVGGAVDGTSYDPLNWNGRAFGLRDYTAPQKMDIIAREFSGVFFNIANGFETLPIQAMVIEMPDYEPEEQKKNPILEPTAFDAEMNGELYQVGDRAYLRELSQFPIY